MVLRAEVSISVETYTWCVRQFNLGDIHPTLVGGDLWWPDELKATRDERARAELRQQGLMEHGSSRLTNLGEDILAVMQRAALEYTTYANVEGVQITVRSAAIGSDAALIVGAQGAIEIEGIPSDQLAIRVATALPDTPAARIHSTTCEEATIQALMDGRQLPPSNRVADAKRLHRWLLMERINVGELGACIRRSAYDPVPLKTTKPVPIWIDTAEGRGLVHADGNGWVSLKGASVTDLAQMFGTLEASLRQRRAGRF